MTNADFVLHRATPTTSANSSQAKSKPSQAKPSMSERQDKEIPTRTDSQSQTTPPESPPAAPPVAPPVAPLAEEQEMPSTGTGSGSGVSASTGALATAPAQQGTDDTDQGVIERDDRESPAGDR